MPPPPVQVPIDVIRQTSRDPRKVQAVADLFAQVDAETKASQAACERCGECCRFATYDHRLFVTTMELAYLLARVGPVSSPPQSQPADCIYLISEQCSIYPHRMLGCRIFLCKFHDSGVPPSSNENWHRALIKLHQAYCVPYSYVDWAVGLAGLSVIKDR
jgi:hypothetical protein